MTNNIIIDTYSNDIRIFILNAVELLRKLCRGNEMSYELLMDIIE